jgi:hypothetical protein
MENKYIKYKTKYLYLKKKLENKMFGGANTPPAEAIPIVNPKVTTKSPREETVDSDDDLPLKLLSEEQLAKFPLSQSTRSLASFANLTKRDTTKRDTSRILNTNISSSQIAEAIAVGKTTLRDTTSDIAAREVRETIAARSANAIKNKKIGEGSIGCVYYPPFKCRYPVCIGERCDHGIAKIMELKDAKVEYNKEPLLKLDEIDPEFIYHFRQPHICEPILNGTSLSNCPLRISTPAMLIYDNGGYNLNDLVNQLKTKIQPSNPDKYLGIMKIIFRSLVNIIEGITLFNKNGVCHLDIKSTNIVTSIRSIESLEGLHLRLIDFGMSVKYNIPISSVNIFNGVNGYNYLDIKKNIDMFFPYFSVDTLFLGLLNRTSLTASDFEYISETVKDYFIYINTNTSHKNLIVLKNIYKILNYTQEQITDELAEVYSENTIDRIIFNYLESHDSFQFVLMLIELCININNQIIKDALIKFLNKSNCLHYNSFKRCKSVNLLDYYNEFLREIE